MEKFRGAGQAEACATEDGPPWKAGPSVRLMEGISAGEGFFAGFDACARFLTESGVFTDCSWPSSVGFF